MNAHDYECDLCHEVYGEQDRSYVRVTDGGRVVCSKHWGDHDYDRRCELSHTEQYLKGNPPAVALWYRPARPDGTYPAPLAACQPCARVLAREGEVVRALRVTHREEGVL